MPRDEVEAAYFALLRARSELDDLRRYREYLVAERQRLRRFRSEGAALAETVDRRLRRDLRETDAQLAETIRLRLELIDDELDRLDDRIAAAAEYVAECEREHEQLRGR